MDYSIIEKNGMWYVQEHSTDHIINFFDTKEKAREFMKFLNKGGSWAGWTPAFFLKTKEINKTFADLYKYLNLTKLYKDSNNVNI